MTRIFASLFFLILTLIPSQYLADSTEETFEVALRLIPDGGKPGNICGPLSIQILKDMRYVSQDIPIKSFWFLTPWDEYTQRMIIEPAFPKDSSLWYRTTTPINQFDFEEFPLRQGDLLFFPYDYSCGGTFSHIIAVTKVIRGIPYAITNHLTRDGWRISELPLYGVENAYFDTLTDQRNTNTIGTTGFCGFYLWRNYGISFRTPGRFRIHRRFGVPFLGNRHFLLYQHIID